jgi:flagellar biosynthesis protein FlhB
MSGQKTEEPTAKRLREARKKGQVAKSQDLTQAALFMTGAGVLAAGGAAYVAQLRGLMLEFFQPSSLTGTLSADELMRRTGNAWGKALLLLAPLFAALFVAAAAVSFLQVRALFSLEVIKPKFEKLNPIKGFQNLFFKPQTYLELLKTLVKLAVVFAVAYSALTGSMHDVILTARADLHTASRIARSLMFEILFKAGAAFVVLGAADFLLQKHMHKKNLKMSKYEVQKEYKEDEGDPHIKHLRKQLHEQMLANDVMAKVPKAKAVVVNPTHLAIALEYDEAVMNAPIVSAKGQMKLASRIITLARQHRVPVIRQVPLAHSLFKVEIGAEIPEDLYGAVAEILNWVYNLQKEYGGNAE